MQFLIATRLIILLISFCFSNPCFGQDTLQIDTIPETSFSATTDTVTADSTAIDIIETQTKTKTRKVQKPKIIHQPVVINEYKPKDVETSGMGIGFIFFGIIVISVIMVLAFSQFNFFKSNRYKPTSTEEEEFMPDYLSRQFMTRRDYYRNVYLKSDAWQRKRYVVLKRDNWQCVYCGGRATQVHHTRYAKRNIGKEPIEWLVSICETCHDSFH